MADTKTIETMRPVVTIPREKAVFWMDARGRWHNRHGPFRHQKIIKHFNTSIRRDKDGYFVSQDTNGVHEKVYFNYEDTALFVIDITETDSAIQLVLNTTVRIDLDPGALMVVNDQLYVQNGADRIKFSERALLKISRYMEYRDEMYYIRIRDKTIPLGRRQAGHRRDP
jgi:hypothetical protein